MGKAVSFSHRKNGWESKLCSCYERLRPTEMDLPLLVPVSRRRDKDALSNHHILSNYALKNDTPDVILTLSLSLSLSLYLHPLSLSFSLHLSSSCFLFLLHMTVANVLIPVVGVVSVYLYLTRKTGSESPKPPGPKPLPLLGNIFNLPAQQLWLRVTDWSQIYGKSSVPFDFPFCRPDGRI